MAQYWWQPNFGGWGGWGPAVDPAPDDWTGGWGGRGGWGGLGGWRVPWPWPGDPAPWFGAARPVAMPQPMQAFAMSQPMQPGPGPFGDPWGGMAGFRPPIPIDPSLWAGGFAAPRGRVRWPDWIADPAPEDLRARVEMFKRWAHGVLQAAGLREDQLARASVADLVQAMEHMAAPPAARTDVAAISAAQVAEMDRPQLDRLKHQLATERQRIEALATHVDAQLEKAKK